jgi:glycosyltransferase involved in cell wall biosynthesis
MPSPADPNREERVRPAVLSIVDPALSYASAGRGAPSDGKALVIVSPVRNEAAHFERVAAAMARQTRPPDLWLVADDSSDDGTRDLLRRLEGEISFLRVIDIPPSPGEHADRLALALEARAFNAALGEVDVDAYTHVGKLDGDIELPDDYFARALKEFDRRPDLGLTGGSIVEPAAHSGSWVKVTAPAHHVHGALKLYSHECFAAVGGIQDRLGWDTIDETYARMRGFETHRLADLVAKHHRPGGSAQGKLRGRARHGECAYIAHYGFPWVAMRSVKVGIRSDPRLISGIAFLYGYVRSAVRRSPRVDDEEFAAFVRAELRGRLRSALVPARLGRQSRPDAAQ